MNLTAHIWGHDGPKEKPNGAQQHTEGPANNSTVILPPQADNAKAFASAQARAALLGHTLQRYGGGFIVNRWGQTKEFGTLTAVEAFLARVGGKS